MADFEARNGPVSFLGDLVWTKIAVDRSGVRSRSLAPGIVGSLGATADLQIEMAILEAGATYEVARFGFAGSDASSVGLDVLAGGALRARSADRLQCPNGNGAPSALCPPALLRERRSVQARASTRPGVRSGSPHHHTSEAYPDARSSRALDRHRLGCAG